MLVTTKKKTDNRPGFIDEVKCARPVLEQVGVFIVVHTDVAILKDSREEIVNLSRNIKYISNTANTQLPYDQQK